MEELFIISKLVRMSVFGVEDGIFSDFARPAASSEDGTAHRGLGGKTVLTVSINRPVRYFAKFAFLPLRPSEVLRICFRKVCGCGAF